jgi:S1-C subfamily serine protease
VLVGLFAVGSAAHAQSDSLEAVEKRQQELFDRTLPSVVFISSEGSFGSGFFVRADGLVLTSAHVVGGASEVKVVLADGRTFTGRVVERADENIDLALVQLPALKTAPLALALNDTLRVGAWVASVGHGRGGVWAYHTGMVSNIYPVGSERPVFQTQIPLNPGDSGGPIIDRMGQVVGVVTAGAQQSSSLNFAIRSDVALRHLRKLGASGNAQATTSPGSSAPAPALIEITAPRGVAIFVDGKMAGTGPRLSLSLDERPHDVFAIIAGKMVKARVQGLAPRTIDLH